MPTVCSASPVAGLIESLRAVGARRDLERRSETRFLLSVIAEVAPLDRHLAPRGPALHALTRDISESGLGLYAEVPAGTRFLRVWLPVAPGETIELLVEIVWREQLGPLVDLGGRFVEADG